MSYNHELSNPFMFDVVRNAYTRHGSAREFRRRIERQGYTIGQADEYDYNICGPRGEKVDLLELLPLQGGIAAREFLAEIIHEIPYIDEANALADEAEQWSIYAAAGTIYEFPLHPADAAPHEIAEHNYLAQKDWSRELQIWSEIGFEALRQRYADIDSVTLNPSIEADTALSADQIQFWQQLAEMRMNHVTPDAEKPAHLSLVAVIPSGGEPGPVTAMVGDRTFTLANDNGVDMVIDAHPGHSAGKVADTLYMINRHFEDSHDDPRGPLRSYEALDSRIANFIFCVADGGDIKDFREGVELSGHALAHKNNEYFIVDRDGHAFPVIGQIIDISPEELAIEMRPIAHEIPEPRIALAQLDKAAAWAEYAMQNYRYELQLPQQKDLSDGLTLADCKPFLESEALIEGATWQHLAMDRMRQIDRNLSAAAEKTVFKAHLLTDPARADSSEDKRSAALWEVMQRDRQRHSISRARLTDEYGGPMYDEMRPSKFMLSAIADRPESPGHEKMFRGTAAELIGRFDELIEKHKSREKESTTTHGEYKPGSYKPAKPAPGHDEDREH